MKYIKYFLIFLALLIVAVIVFTYTDSKPKKAKKNPYEYNVDEYKKVNQELISHSETRQFKIKTGEHGALATHGGNIYFAGNQQLSVISPGGEMIRQFPVQASVRAIDVDDKNIVLVYRSAYQLFDHEGKVICDFNVKSDSSVFTSVAFWNDKIMVADAGMRKIYAFDRSEISSTIISEIEGVSGAKNLHGFIIPSPYFELAVNNEDELWATNPGMHALQQYDLKGNLLDSWDKASMEIEGFTGCCNPAQFTFMADGRFVTSEKGMPRIKIYRADGSLESVVAPPSAFAGEKAPEIATMGESIVALDFDQQMIRIFEAK